MQFVEALSKAIVGGINATVSQHIGQSQNNTQKRNKAIFKAQSITPPQSSNLTLNPPTSYDPGYQKAECLRIVANSLQQIAIGGQNGAVDWSAMDDTRQSGLAWVKGTMETALGTSFSTEKPSVTAKQLFTTGVQVGFLLSIHMGRRPSYRHLASSVDPSTPSKPRSRPTRSRNSCLKSMTSRPRLLNLRPRLSSTPVLLPPRPPGLPNHLRLQAMILMEQLLWL